MKRLAVRFRKSSLTSLWGPKKQTASSCQGGKVSSIYNNWITNSKGHQTEEKLATTRSQSDLLTWESPFQEKQQQIATVSVSISGTRGLRPISTRSTWVAASSRSRPKGTQKAGGKRSKRGFGTSTPSRCITFKWSAPRSGSNSGGLGTNYQILSMKW